MALFDIKENTIFTSLFAKAGKGTYEKALKNKQKSQ